ncbi:hypothetical protein, partial [Umezakia ovalisporum]|uniref:hypothetical protein n=1 Tax=Umezakia ovalisporum TaxID=75695 RepID=UPI0039C62FD4
MFGLILGFITSFSVLADDSIQPKPPRPVVWKLYPLLYYTTETRGVAEIFSYVQFQLKDAMRSSNIRFVANYTQEKQYTLLVPVQICFKQDKYFAQGKVELTHYPEYFYGLGNNTMERKRELYSFESANLQLTVYKR